MTRVWYGSHRRALAALAAVLAALPAAACGSNALSDSQLRSRANRICLLARRHTDRVRQPTLPSQGARFLSRGIAALAPQRRALLRLHPPDDMDKGFSVGVRALSAELAAMRSTLKGLRDGNDPVVAMKTLQQELAGPERRAARAWGALEVRQCAALTA